MISSKISLGTYSRWIARFGAASLLALSAACASSSGSEPATQSAPVAPPPQPEAVTNLSQPPAPYASAPVCGPGYKPDAHGRCGAPLPPAPDKRPRAAQTPPPAPPAVEAPAAVPGGLARGTGDPADAALLEGDRAYQRDDFAAARKAYARAKQLAPKDPAPRVGLARVALAEGPTPIDYAAAPKDARMQALLRDLDATLRLDRRYGATYIERGRVLLVLGKAEDALGSLARAVELSPDDPEAQSALGVAFLATGKTAEALERLKRAAELDPRNPDRLTNLGTAYMMRGRVEDAIKAYERAAELAPDDARTQGDLGTAYLGQNRPDKALNHLKRAVELAPDRATFLSNLGYAQQLSGQVDDAIATYRKALAKDEKLGSAWINLGTALAQKHQYDEAERAFKRALALDPTDPRAKANLSDLAELRKGKTKPE